MKASLNILVLIISLLFLHQCKSVHKEAEPLKHSIPFKNVMEKTLILNVMNHGIALNSVYLYLIADSLERQQFAKHFLSETRFFDDESGYFFMESYSGYNLVDGAFPQIEGAYRLDEVTPDGFKYVEQMIKRATHNGQGWVNYTFINPGTGLKDQKSAFVKAIPAANWYIGAGYYAGEILDHDALSHSQSIDYEYLTLVKSMSQSIASVYQNYNKTDAGNYVKEIIHYVTFNSDMSGYFFIYDLQGKVIAHGATPELEGQNLYNYRDASGNYVIQDLIRKVKTEGHGFVDYYWKNPADGKTEAKRAYVTKITGIDYFIGSGFYHQ